METTTQDLRMRAAEALGWSYQEACTFSLPTLAAAVRPANAELAKEINEYTRAERHVLTPVTPRRRDAR